MASIKDVAAQAGVSTTTVSRVLTDPQAVRPVLRERVEAAIAALAYRPNLAARRLRQHRIRNKRGLCVAGLANKDAAIFGLINKPFVLGYPG